MPPRARRPEPGQVVETRPLQDPGTRHLPLRRALSARLPPAGLCSRGASGCICPRKTPATRLRCAAREPRSPLCGHAGKATIIVLSRSARPCDAPYTRGLLDPYHVLCGETEAQSQFPKATHGELEFEPELPNSGAQGLTPHLAGRLWAPPFPISHLLSLCHLTFLLPLGWGSQFAAGDC